MLTDETRTISDEDLGELRAAQTALCDAAEASHRARTAFAEARGAFSYCLDRIRRRYDLSAGEDIAMETGAVIAIETGARWD